MVWNEELKREIPEGWENINLQDLCDKIGDGIHGTPKYVEQSEYSFINGNNLKNGFIQTDNETKKVSLEEYEKCFIPLNENSILLSINGTLGNLAVFTGEKVMLGKSSAYINCKENNRAYCYQFLKQGHMPSLFWNIATGSTIKNLSLDSIKKLKILKPNNNLIEQFHLKTKAIDDKRKNIFIENQELASLRDWFLPMLMNGQVSVGDVAEELGMVAEASASYEVKKN
jgi:type I restriction enzyme S subunit